MAPFGWVSGRRRRPFGRSTPWWRGSSAAPAGVSLSLPLHPRAECQGHGRQQRQGHGEARQVRLHDTTSWIEVCAVPPATGRSSQGRSLALRPRLTTGLPWTVVHRGASIAPTRTLDGGGPAGHRPLVPRSDAARVSAATHQARPVESGGPPRRHLLRAGPHRRRSRSSYGAWYDGAHPAHYHPQV